jgi:acyl carrier protein
MRDLRQSLRTALVTRLGVRNDINDDTGLFSEGLLDSMSVMDLIVLVEEQLQCVIPPVEITFENFDSINRIQRFADRLRSQGGGA